MKRVLTVILLACITAPVWGQSTRPTFREFEILKADLQRTRHELAADRARRQADNDHLRAEIEDSFQRLTERERQFTAYQEQARQQERLLVDANVWLRRKLDFAQHFDATQSADGLMKSADGSTFRIDIGRRDGVHTGLVFDVVEQREDFGHAIRGTAPTARNRRQVVVVRLVGQSEAIVRPWGQTSLDDLPRRAALFNPLWEDGEESRVLMLPSSHRNDAQHALARQLGDAGVDVKSIDSQRPLRNDYISTLAIVIDRDQLPFVADTHSDLLKTSEMFGIPLLSAESAARFFYTDAASTQQERTDRQPPAGLPEPPPVVNEPIDQSRESRPPLKDRTSSDPFGGNSNDDPFSDPDNPPSDDPFGPIDGVGGRARDPIPSTGKSRP